MKKAIVAILAVAATCSGQSNVQAKDKSDDYQKGTLMQMDSASCGSAEKGSKTVAGELLGTDAQQRKTQVLLCQEYVMKTDRLVYHIRPKDDKHPALLPVGETAQFRIHKDKMLLSVPEVDNKEREYIVVSIAQRTDIPDRAATASSTTP